MGELSRRVFLLRSSLAAAAAATVASAPGLVTAIGAAGSESPAAEDAVVGADAEAPSLAEPLVAHVTNLSTGEISVFSGTREVVAYDPALAARLARAARG